MYVFLIVKKQFDCVERMIASQKRCTQPMHGFVMNRSAEFFFCNEIVSLESPRKLNDCAGVHVSKVLVPSDTISPYNPQ